jgi:hypothetical protein
MATEQRTLGNRERQIAYRQMHRALLSKMVEQFVDELGGCQPRHLHAIMAAIQHDPRSSVG